MILLDTNVMYEPWKPVPNEQVVDWPDAQVVETLFLSAISVAELRFGIAASPWVSDKLSFATALRGKCCSIFPDAFCPSSGKFAVLL